MTHYKITAPKKILDELDLDSTDSLVTKSGTTPIWFSGYSFNATITDGVLHFSTHSHNRDFLMILSAVCPSDIIHVVEINEFDGREMRSLWKNGIQILYVIEDMGGFHNTVAEYLLDSNAYTKLLDGTWKEIFEGCEPREIDKDTIEVTVTFDEAFGCVMTSTGMITVTQNPLRVRIYQPM